MLDPATLPLVAALVRYMGDFIAARRSQQDGEKLRKALSEVLHRELNISVELDDLGEQILAALHNSLDDLGDRLKGLSAGQAEIRRLLEKRRVGLLPPEATDDALAVLQATCAAPGRSLQGQVRCMASMAVDLTDLPPERQGPARVCEGLSA